MSNTFHTLCGVLEGYDAFVIAREAARVGAAIHVARDDRQLAQMQDALRFFAPELPVIRLPSWDCLPYDRVSVQADIAAVRMATLAALVRGPDKPFVLLTTLNGAGQFLPPRAVLRKLSFPLKVGAHVDEAGLRAFLARMGFSKAPSVTEPGDFALRGGLMDIYPPGDSGPVRLDFFGDTLDGIRRFDPINQRTLDRLEEMELAPVSEVILDEPSILRFRQRYRSLFGAAGAKDPLYEAVSAGRKIQGVEHWLPLFHEYLETVFDYLPQASIFIDEYTAANQAERWETIQAGYEARCEALKAGVAERGIETVYKPVPPEQLYLSPQAWMDALQDRHVLRIFALPQPPGPRVTDMGARAGRNFSPERQSETRNLFSEFADHLRHKAHDRRVVVASYSDGARERVTGLLRDEDILHTTEISDVRDLDGPGIYLAVWPLERGFEAEIDGKAMTVISEQDVLGERLVRSVRKKRRAENFLTEAQSLSVGDLVVHVDHGVGRYHGLEIMTAAGAAHECLHLEYAEQAKLYLPVENIELLSRYGQEEGVLDRLGSGAWQARKARLKERIREMADRLIRIAAERELRSGGVLTPPPGAYETFCARFPYEETEDQQVVIETVLEDLSAGRPMDRLVCGDVGFGKTEVAMRAAFVAALSGVQVAVIAPTTLLARQHAKSFAERFRGFPVVLRQLSRFVSARGAKDTREGLQKGTVDIVIGTHAVLAAKVKFHNLGLVIVDEEQRFGVQHKERLKELRSNVHVLTLTATPIPRTLQLSLTGVRDISIIGTPPVDRLAIRTYVGAFDTIAIREALLREHYRGGQSFFVVARIADLPEVEEWLRDHVPEVRFVVAHGRLAAGELDLRMNAFYDGKYDVLLATTIIESGLDIPTANTMIVHRADMFGLAQLYQIRGRVGRSKSRAYAYLTTKAMHTLTPSAQRRLRVLGSLDSLGAGFALASQDLDIRGAGNLLGEAQSGQVHEVGYELFQQMLEETIAKIRRGELESLPDAGEQWAPQINLGLPVMIPERYVPDLDVRLGLYRRLSGLTKKVEFEGFAAELIDRFGTLPKEVNSLLLIVRIKAMCKRAGIARLDGGPRGATLQFHNDKFANPGGLVQFLQDQRGLAKMRDNKVVVRRDWKKNSDKIKGAFAIARDLAEWAERGSP